MFARDVPQPSLRGREVGVIDGFASFKITVPALRRFYVQRVEDSKISNSITYARKACSAEESEGGVN